MSDQLLQYPLPGSAIPRSSRHASHALRKDTLLWTHGARATERRKTQRALSLQHEQDASMRLYGDDAENHWPLTHDPST